MKLGQILSFIDPSLPPETRALLSVLQRQAPPSDRAAVHATVQRAFGPRASELLSVMEPRPFSVASVGQVHRASLPDGRQVVVKVLHPGIRQAFENDFSSALGGMGVANLLTFGGAADARGLLDEVRTTMLAECDLRREAEAQRTYRRWVNGAPELVIPEVVDAWSSEEVLTTVFEGGDTLDQVLSRNPTQATRDHWAATLFRASVRGFHELGLLHADPHPGNFAFREGGVVLYDFGCVRRFTLEQTQAFAAIPPALRANDRPAMVDAAVRFGFRLTSQEQHALFERFARSYFAPLLGSGPSRIPPDGAFEAKQLMADKRAMRKLGLPPHLMFLLRLRFGLYAVLSRLGAACDWGALEESPWHPSEGGAARSARP